jgi:ABC-type polysaccharide/polyol phosphate transport system ATPase subunit
MGKTAIRLNGISKKYFLYNKKPTLVEYILSLKKPDQFWALKGINLSIKQGETVGIIGPNGAGKTTLFNIICKITAPTKGSVLTKGKVVSLIELEAGFHPDLTGIENIYLNGLILGMTKDEIKSRLDDIESFADIGNFINSPMYTYSKGMKLRLGFSIAVNASPEILAIDENISVGDEDFQKKSLNKIKDFYHQGKTVIVSSHYLSFIRKSCKRTIWLDKGKIVKDGKTSIVTKTYEQNKR